MSKTTKLMETWVGRAEGERTTAGKRAKPHEPLGQERPLRFAAGGLIDTMQKSNPGEDVFAVAFRTLKTAPEIRRFYKEYLDALRAGHSRTRFDPSPDAVALMGVIGRSKVFGDKTMGCWENALAAERRRLGQEIKELFEPNRELEKLAGLY